MPAASLLADGHFLELQLNTRTWRNAGTDRAVTTRLPTSLPWDADISGNPYSPEHHAHMDSDYLYSLKDPDPTDRQARTEINPKVPQTVTPILFF